MSFLKGGLITFITQLISLIGSFVMSIILARSLGPEGRGAFAVMILVVFVLSKIGSLGIEVANVYYSANRRDLVPVLAGNSIIISVFVGFALIAVTLIVTSFIPQVRTYMVSNSVPMPLYYAILLAVPASLLTGFFTGLLQGREMVLQFNTVSFSIVVSNLVLLTTLMLGFKWGLTGAVFSYLLATAMSMALAVIFVRWRFRIPIALDVVALRLEFGYAGKSYLANLAQFLNYRLDQFLIGYFLGPASLGLYVVSVGLAERLWMMPQSIATVLLPRISASNIETANSLTSRMARNILFLLILMSLAMGASAPILIPLLFGDEFAAAVGSLLWLLPGMIALGYGKILSSDLLGRGMPHVGLMISVVSLVVTIILDLVLIPIFGIVGAAVASSVAYTICSAIVFIVFVHTTRVSMRKLLVIDLEDLRFYVDLVNRLYRRIRYPKAANT